MAENVRSNVIMARFVGLLSILAVVTGLAFTAGEWVPGLVGVLVALLSVKAIVAYGEKRRWFRAASPPELLPR